MSAADLIEDLVLSGWRFWIEDGKLKYRALRSAATPELLSRLKACKSEIFVLLETSPERLNVCPLSYGQRALWFIWKLSPHSSAYNLSLPISLDSSAEAEGWRAACTLLVQRHPILRTVFAERTAGAVQKVKSSAALDWAALDASDWSEARLVTAMAEAHGHPFDLERGPLVRFRWFGKSEASSILLITMHHIVSDGWSVEIMRRQLPRFYEEARCGRMSSATSPHSYQDYVRWQLAMLEGPAGKRLWEYWSEQLAGPLPVLNLPTDYPRPALKTYAGGSVPIWLSQELCRKVNALARDAGVTSYVAFMAAFLVLLHRYCGQDDLLIGSPHTGRSRAEFAAIVGYFVDPILIRSRLMRGESFREFLQHVQRTTHDALAHSDFPFALIVERLHPERDASRSPLFDVSFNYLARQSLDGEAAGSLAVRDMPQADGKFDLTVTIHGAGDALTAALGFNTDLFRPETVARLADAFAVVLESVAHDPQQNVELIPLQRETDACRPIIEGPFVPLRPEHMVHLLFEAQAASQPDAIAVRAEDALVTYGELNRRANGLARRLRDCGVARDTLVGIKANRSAAFVVALLAIHKAGAAYVPLDHGYPPHLLGHMVIQGGIRIILTDGAPPELAAPNLRVMSLPVFFSESCSSHDANLPPQSGLGDLAYVIFTSGSTGVPKGVAVEHRSLANYVQSMRVDLDIAAKSSFALASTVSADLGHTMLFLSLCSGGCLHMLPEAAALDGGSFADYIRHNAIDYLKIVPSHLIALIDSCAGAALPRRALILGGESTSRRWAESLLATAGNCAIVNHYGPTEATVGVLTYRMHKDGGGLPHSSLPLRKAAANTAIYLLDADRRNVLPGMVGELHIGGDCLARGYINAPELTRDGFIALGQCRAYRTGDLARQLPNGDVEILGRRDRQVKVRGFRVEIAQVEGCLRADPLVRQCVVLPDGDRSSVEHLTAFIVGAPGLPRGAAAVDDMRQRAQRALPSYMVPSRFVVLDEMPLTLNGKVDTEALYRLGREPAPDAQAALPRDAIELELTEIWSDLLGVPVLGINDDFFQLGGHSLLAVRLAGRIHDKFKCSISLATLLTNPSIAALADVLRSSGKSSRSSPLVPIRRQGSGPPLFFLPGAGGNVLYFYPLSSRLDGGMPCWGLQALGLNPASRIPASIEDIAATYVDLIKQELQPDGPYLLAGHSFGALVAFEMVRLFIRQGQAIRFLGLIDNAAPGATTEAPPDKSDAEWLGYIALRIGKLYGVELTLDGHFASKSYGDQVDGLIDRMISSRLLPRGLNKTYFARFIDVYKANAVAASSYRPDDKIPIPVTLFRAASADRDLNAYAESSDPALGWRRYAAAVEVVETSGTHLTMFSMPHVCDLADRLSKAIADARIFQADELAERT